MSDERNEGDDDLPDDEWAGDEDADAFDDELDSTDPWLDDRSVFMFRAKQPFADWVRQLEDREPEWVFPDIDRCRAVLAPELPGPADAEEWLRQNHEEVFERLLRVWADDREKWPAELSLERLHEWFDVTFAPVVEDMAHAELEHEFTCPAVSLRRLRDEFVQLPKDGSLWVDTQSGEILAWTDDELEAIRDGTTEGLDVSAEDLEALQRAIESGALIAILHRLDVRDRSLMLEFAKLVEPAAVSRRLALLVNGKKGARRFGEALETAGLRDRWSEWFEDQIADELANALDERGVPYIDDVSEADGPEDER